MATDQEIGARLRRARIAAGFAKAADAARAFNMAYSTYAAHENGSRGLRANLEKYSRKFKVTLDWLLTERGPGPIQRETDVELAPQADTARILNLVADWQASDPDRLRELREFADQLRADQPPAGPSVGSRAKGS